MRTKHEILKLFIDILLDNGRHFPKSIVSSDEEDRKRLYSDFKAKLMRFWVGGRVEFVTCGYPKITDNGFVLYLPEDIVDKKDLYVKLIVATFNMEAGKHLYGGNKL